MQGRVERRREGDEVTGRETVQRRPARDPPRDEEDGVDAEPARGLAAPERDRLELLLDAVRDRLGMVHAVLDCVDRGRRRVREGRLHLVRRRGEAGGQMQVLRRSLLDLRSLAVLRGPACACTRVLLSRRCRDCALPEPEPEPAAAARVVRRRRLEQRGRAVCPRRGRPALYPA